MQPDENFLLTFLPFRFHYFYNCLSLNNTPDSIKTNFITSQHLQHFKFYVMYLHYIFKGIAFLNKYTQVTYPHSIFTSLHVSDRLLLLQVILSQER